MHCQSERIFTNINKHKKMTWKNLLNHFELSMMVCHLFTIFGNTNITKRGCCISLHRILLNLTFVQGISTLPDEGVCGGKNTL